MSKTKFNCIKKCPFFSYSLLPKISKFRRSSLRLVFLGFSSNTRSRIFLIGNEKVEKMKFCLGELQSFSVFVMLKATFSKLWSVKLPWHMSTQNLKFKIWYNRNDCSYKWRLHRMITWKLLFHGEEMKLLIAKDLNLLRGIFLMEKMSKFWVLGRIFPHPQRFPWSFRWRESSPHLVGATILWHFC